MQLDLFAESRKEGSKRTGRVGEEADISDIKKEYKIGAAS